MKRGTVLTVLAVLFLLLRVVYGADDALPEEINITGEGVKGKASMVGRLVGIRSDRGVDVSLYLRLEEISKEKNRLYLSVGLYDRQRNEMLRGARVVARVMTEGQEKRDIVLQAAQALYQGSADFLKTAQVKGFRVDFKKGDKSGSVEYKLKKKESR